MSDIAPGAAVAPEDMKKVAIATIIGTTIEWYDFFLYAQAAGLVFGALFFAGAGPQVAVLVSFATVGVSFLFRPVGAFLAGHLGDRWGRKVVLVWTLILMGAATTLVGVLPTYAQIGVAAPVLLITLRILQGLSTGGEWGGAILLAVEHAPRDRRGRFGSFPQMGVPLGMLLASGVLALMTGVISPGGEFLAWGWRVPFLLSIVLVVVGIVVRRTVEESPVFAELARTKERSRTPILELFRRHWPLLALTALTFAGNNAAGYMTTGGFLQSYATTPLSRGGSLGMNPTPVLLAVLGSSVVWLVFTAFGGVLSDRIGRRSTYIIGWIAFLITVWLLFPLVDTGNAWLFFLGVALFTIGNGLTYGPQAAWFAELYPASIRYSGVSIAYALGAILGGAFAPLISTALVQRTGTSFSVAVYMAVAMVIALGATLALRDRTGLPLGPEAEDAQRANAVRGLSRA